MSSGAERGAGRPRAGFLGPAGTFSEEALLASALEGSVEPVALASITDAVLAVAEQRLELSIVPIENSLEGSITVTLDLLADEALTVQVAGEALLRVRHALICAAPTPLAQIRTVLTHPQVPGQCTRFLRTELAHARVIAASSTAEAVREVAGDAQPGRAAIGTELAASIYGGEVVRAGVQDRDDNETRFVWLAPAGGGVRPPLRAPTHAAGGGEWKTSLVFWGAGAERAGWLVRCLQEFAGRDINLTKIESRPRRERMGSYMFFADLSGRIGEQPLDRAIAGLRAICAEVRVLGCYEAAAPAQDP